MQKITASDPAAHSVDVRAGNIDKLKTLFPELITEGADGTAINVDVLKQLVGDTTVTDADEKYGLNWHGKRRARQLALTPSTGTLRPRPEDSVDWDTTQNLMIEGDNLEVLKLLQKSYANKVKLIYIDPPYNTGKDFVYPDNFQDSIKNYLELTGQVEGGAKVSSNTEASGRFHTDWLNMMYPRLKLAKALLRKDGLICISIDDNEVASLKAVLDEIFGRENYCATFVWNTEGNTDNQYKVKVNHEYVLAYYRDVGFSDDAVGRIVDPNTRSDSNLWKGVADNNINKNNPENPPSIVELPIGFPCSEKELFYPKKILDDAFFSQTLLDKFISDSVREKYEIESKSGLPVKLDDMVVKEFKLEKPCRIYVGMANKNKLLEFISNDCNAITDDGAPLKFYINANAAVRYNKENDRPRNILSVLRNLGTTEKSKTELKNLGIYYDYPKPLKLVEYLIKIGCEDPKGIVLDFFAGSGTTGHAVMNLNSTDGSDRRFICVQLQEKTDVKSEAKIRGFENLSEICKRRLKDVSVQLTSKQLGLLDQNRAGAGFRVFELDASNIRAWQPSEDLEKDLVDNVEHIAPGRSEDDVLTELLLKLGLDLCVPIEQRQIASKRVHAIGGGVLLACLDTSITAADAEALVLGIADWHRQLAPSGDTTCVFRDSAFADDVAKTNLAAILDQHGIHTVRSL
jgi:adenine-specific DNA-methyltransferase